MRNSVIPLLVLALAVVLAACGSAEKSLTAKTDPSLEFSQCMRSHGVSNFPDPGADGTLDITPSSGINPQSPAFQAAQQACKQYAPNKGAPPQMSESQRRAAFRFSQCMRRNGEPDFPDPTQRAASGVGPVLVLRGMVFAIGTDIDPKSPAFREAAARCGVTPPGVAPTGRPSA